MRVRRYDEGPAKYRHYNTYQPGKIAKKSAPTARRRNALTLAKHRSHKENAQRWRIIATIAVCVLVILGAVLAKIWAGDAPTAREPEITTVKPTKPIEPSGTELQKQIAEQNLKTIAGILDSTKFSTDTVIKLKVPIYKQVYTQSCEAASLRMALAYRGIETTDLKILELMNYDDQPAKKIDGKWQWGDPHQMFVGDKNGDQTKMTGYGVFGEPIQKASEKLGRTAVVQNEVKPEWLARQIYAGNPVVLWGVSTKIKDEKWTTPEAKEITAPIRTHTRLVIGVKGDINQPTGFYLNDPDGTVKYWTTAQLTSNIAAGIGQAVAIH